MKTFRTYQLAVEFYRLTDSLPLKGDAKEQFSRASRSVVLNLAEGRGRATTKEQRRFFTIAMGSLRECQAVMTLEFLEQTPAWNALDRVAAALYRLIQNAR